MASHYVHMYIVMITSHRCAAELTHCTEKKRLSPVIEVSPVSEYPVIEMTLSTQTIYSQSFPCPFSVIKLVPIPVSIHEAIPIPVHSHCCCFTFPFSATQLI